MEFDFDKWAQLAQDDPAEFERQREAALRALIATAPEANRQRLEGLQFRIDLERRRSTSALGSCVRLNALMWSGFHRLRRQLNEVEPRSPSEPGAGPRSAEVIPLAAARERRNAGRGGKG